MVPNVPTKLNGKYIRLNRTFAKYVRPPSNPDMGSHEKVKLVNLHDQDEKVYCRYLSKYNECLDLLANFNQLSP